MMQTRGQPSATRAEPLTEVGWERRDPLAAYIFKIEFDVQRGGVTGPPIVVSCSEINGLQVDMKTHEYQEGGCNDYVHHFRGQASYPALVLKRGLTDSDDFWCWHRDVVNGIVVRRSGGIALLDPTDGSEYMHWDFIDAMPIKWSMPGLNAATSALAFESIELVHRGLQWKSTAQNATPPA